MAGMVRPERLNPKWLSQAYAQRKWLEAVTGRRVIPMLVFSRAFLVGTAVSRQRGVTVLPARMLVGRLRRQPTVLSAADVQDPQGRLHRSFSARTSLTAEPH
jgi:hypothetical protein